jgi:hypothetical protein
MVVAVICALATATCLGYYAGRRAASKPPTWKQRTSRIALGRLAINLLVLMTARRVRRGFRNERLPAVLRPRTIGPVDFLRAGVAWMRP